ncbi:hypothetical protein [Shewanella sedimentimangrovi]|uniref:Uncharacterized protein n=1 Tax=Shewanella sedimentimangrovi TaxID=2814293 RepID=A0ABX7QY45_9GAMM|nr:hypothetical protein [Shewanella sedimentimangrovi]QSX36436.1 hypothetical protein JYB85_14220 [Shewanella sedimentimangrovi]
MNQAIQFLVTLGSDASLQTQEALAKLPVHIIAMIEAKDIEALKAELDVAPEIVCALLPAEDEDDQGENEQGDTPAKEEISACA